jgi:glutathione S-transferase
LELSALTLIIGNRNYSSWSLRPWMLLRHLGLEFTTELVPLDQPDSARRLQELSPSGRVPALRHGELLLWDSIAIGEYLCELTGRGLPRERNARALARCISAEMHAGFQALRTQWPMNARASGRHTPMTAALLRDIARIDALWCECRTQPGAPRPWLFGEYSLADAMYAPVALRFRTYGAQLSPEAARYVDTVLADPVMQEWLAAAAAEPWTIGADEAGA